VSWEKGRDTFDRWLIDGDASLNSGNWMWLSASSFFYQYFRVYSPVTFGKKYDPEGKYVKHFLPILKVRHSFLWPSLFVCASGESALCTSLLQMRHVTGSYYKYEWRFMIMKRLGNGLQGVSTGCWGAELSH